MVDVEVIAATQVERPGDDEIARLCRAACARLGIAEGHIAVEFVDAQRIAELNAGHRGKEGPTDVLSFPIDGLEGQQGVPRELGDIVICAAETADIREAIVHGTLHLLGMDHESDDGEMLALQDELMAEAR
ncbi:MAG TPA: rRNA maturation RNase YbeY [Solirubrobacteraceae bacterium]|nr:rRNA maturation RNase YbeY [Solirubrobacteraceae bacterium]